MEYSQRCKQRAKSSHSSLFLFIYLFLPFYITFWPSGSSPQPWVPRTHLQCFGAQQSGGHPSAGPAGVWWGQRNHSGLPGSLVQFCWTSAAQWRLLWPGEKQHRCSCLVFSKSKHCTSKEKRFFIDTKTSKFRQSINNERLVLWIYF